MATHIVSWGDSKPIISPINPSTPSIVSIDSIQTSSVVRDAHCVTESKNVNSVLNKVLNEPSGSETASTSASTYPRADETDTSFVRHPKYFFKDGNVTFLVSGIRS